MFKSIFKVAYFDIIHLELRLRALGILDRSLDSRHGIAIWSLRA